MSNWGVSGGGSIIPTSSCPAPMTRAQLIALRNASQLDTGCHYLVTDYVGGRLVAGTTILIHAVAVNEVSEAVSVNTTYDNEAWRGIYDLDRNLVLELTDNLGNVARGQNGLEVANFDWGNGNYRQCLVDDATWNMGVGVALAFRNVSVVRGALLTTSGKVGGSMTNVVVADGSQVNLTGANISITNSEFLSLSILTGNNYTGASAWHRVRMSGNSTVNISTSTIPVTFTDVEVSNAGAISIAGNTTGTVGFTRVRVAGTANITKAIGSGNLTIDSSEINTGAVIAHRIGSFAVGRGTFLSGSSVQTNGTAVAFTSTTSEFKSGGSVNLTAGSMNLVRTTVEQIGSVLRSSGVGSMTFDRVELRHNSSIVTNAGGAGAVQIVDTTVDSVGNIQANGDGALTVTQCRFDSFGRVLHSGPRAYSVVRCVASSLGTLTLSSTVAGPSDTVNDSSFIARGQLTMNNTGAATTQVQWCVVSGISGIIQITGSSTAVAANRLTVDNGIITFSNCATGVAVQVCSASDSGQIVIQNNVGSVNMSQCQARASSVIRVSGTTGPYTINNVTADANATVDATTAAVTLVSATVRNGGRLVHNGGTSSFVDKSQSSTLTTGAFTHSNIAHHTATTKTLTVGNANRADYMGMAAQLV